MSRMLHLAGLLLHLTVLFSVFHAGLQASTLRGTLYDEQGNVVSAAQLVIVNVGTEEQLVVETDEEGNFDTSLQPGEYEIYQFSTPDNVLLTGVTLEPDRIVNLELSSSLKDDDGLAAIRDYEVGLNQSTEVDSQSFNDLINPFPARRQGRLFGSLYWFHRNDNFDARNFFDPVGEPLPEYKRNQFGGTLSWIQSQRFMVQGTYDSLRIIQGSTLLSHLPTQAQKNGDFGLLEQEIIDPLTGEAFPGNQIPLDRISPVATRVLPVLPDPNRDDIDRNHVNNDPKVFNHDSFTFKVDYEPKEASKLIFNYSFRDVDQALVHALPSFNSDRLERYQSGSVSYNRSLTDRLLTELRLSFWRGWSIGASRNAGSEGLLDSLGIAGVAVEDPSEEGYPDFEVSGYAAFGDQNSPMTWTRNNLSLDTGFTYALNNHTFRGGFDANTRQLNNYRSDGLHRGRFVFSGYYSNDGFSDFLLGIPNSAYRGIGSDRVDLRAIQWNFFLRDQWRITRDFDFTVGARYEYNQPYHSNRDNVSGFHPLLFEPPKDGEIIVAGSGPPLVVDIGGEEFVFRRGAEVGFDGAVDGSLVFPDRNNWAPQLGFAYSPLGTNQVVLRGSYSMNYSPLSEWHYVNSLSRNAPFFYPVSVEASPTDPAISLSNPFASEASPELTIRGIEPRIQDESSHYWRLELQNEVARNWTFEMRYIGRRGTQTTRVIPGNVPEPGPEEIQPRRPNPDFGLFSVVTNGGNWGGHSFEVSAQRRLSRGLAFNSGFEWNRVLDDNFYMNPSNPRNLDAEKATATWFPQRGFFLNYIIDLPIGSGRWLSGTSSWSQYLLDGWRLSGITHIRDGRFFSARMPGDPNNDGVSGDRPNRIGPGNLDSSERSVDMWFNPLDFAEPPAYGFGDAGRNILMAPGYHAWDVSVIKQTRLSDGDVLEFRVEFFNAFNQVNFERPESDFGTSVFGKIFGAERAREIEVALKYSF